MTTEWKPAVAAQTVHGYTRQTIRASFTNEPGHDVLIGGQTLRVLPEGRTGSRQRSCTIADALAAAVAMQAAPETTLRLVVGSLLLVGASNLWLDGERLTPEPGEAIGQWVLTLRGDGSVDSRFVGGGE